MHFCLKSQWWHKGKGGWVCRQCRHHYVSWPPNWEAIAEHGECKLDEHKTWQCEACDAPNYSWRMACRTCDAPNPKAPTAELLVEWEEWDVCRVTLLR